MDELVEMLEELRIGLRILWEQENPGPEAACYIAQEDTVVYILNWIEEHKG